jgi:hypothetical protein
VLREVALWLLAMRTVERLEEQLVKLGMSSLIEACSMSECNRLQSVLLAAVLSKLIFACCKRVVFVSQSRR